MPENSVISYADDTAVIASGETELLKSEEELEEFYNDVIKAYKETPSKLNILIGDLNAKLEQRYEGHETAFGLHGFGKKNDGGTMLLEFLLEHNMYAMNSISKKSPKRKWTWMSSDGATRNEIDYIITDRKGIIRDVSVLNSFSVGSDHRLVLRKILSTGSKDITMLRNTKGRATMNKEEILRVLEEFYGELYRPPTHRVITIPYVQSEGSEDIADITTSEIDNALRQMKDNRASRGNGVMIEAVKAGGRCVLQNYSQENLHDFKGLPEKNIAEKNVTRRLGKPEECRIRIAGYWIGKMNGTNRPTGWTPQDRKVVRIVKVARDKSFLSHKGIGRPGKDGLTIVHQDRLVTKLEHVTRLK
ncbi:hypothetical protein HUJ05_002158 [Dendroctonus ponderosae]|nr:hypothetical protein HUJ05_002158 [Dendroctonus ponderosae]